MTLVRLRELEKLDDLAKKSKIRIAQKVLLGLIPLGSAYIAKKVRESRSDKGKTRGKYNV